MRTIFAQSTMTTNGEFKAENGQDNRAVVDALVNSRTYRDYETAFGNLTGLPIALQPVETWQLPHHSKRNENPLCALMSQKSSACAACLQVQERLCRQAAIEPQTITCALGLADSAVPVRMNGRLIGFLQIGQVFRKKPTNEQFEKVVVLAAKWGVEADRATLKRAVFSGKVVTHKEHDSALKLLGIFAEQLAAMSNQVFIQRENAEPAAIAKARAYIEEHQHEDLSLGQVAKAASMSSFLAGSLGLPFIPAKSLLGSDILTYTATAKKKYSVMDSPFDGEKVVLLPACRPDVAIIHVTRADDQGNCQIDGTTFADEFIAKSADHVVLITEQLISNADIRRNPKATVVPAFRVDAVVHCPWGAYPTAVPSCYDYDYDALKAYQKATSSPESFQAYLDRFVYGVKDFDEYLEIAGTPRTYRRLAIDPRLGYSSYVTELIGGGKQVSKKAPGEY